MLLDSLVLDLAQAAREHQQQRQRLEHLQDLASEVAALGAAEHAELLQRAACQPDSDPQQLAELTERCNAILTAHLQQQAALARRASLHALLEQERWLDVQLQVKIESEFLKRDLAEREERAIRQAAETRQQHRRLQENASALLQALDANP
ncbi:hypothetical protein ACV35W_32610, partial [Pseudomonas aeruginosa]